MFYCCFFFFHPIFIWMDLDGQRRSGRTDPKGLFLFLLILRMWFKHGLLIFVGKDFQTRRIEQILERGEKRESQCRDCSPQGFPPVNFHLSFSSPQKQEEIGQISQSELNVASSDYEQLLACAMGGKERRETRDKWFGAEEEEGQGKGQTHSAKMGLTPKGGLTSCNPPRIRGTHMFKHGKQHLWGKGRKRKGISRQFYVFYAFIGDHLRNSYHEATTDRVRKFSGHIRGGPKKN